MRVFRVVPIVIASLLCSTCSAESPFPEFVGVCRHVVDGDSLYLQGEKTQIRLWGVDAPERNEPGYLRATRNLKRLALGRKLRCQQVDRDKYGRIVARCYVVEHSNDKSVEVNWEQISLPQVREYCHFTDNYYGQCVSKKSER